MPEDACLTFYFFKLFNSIIQNNYRLICIGLGLRLVDFGIVPWESAFTCILNSIGRVESFRRWLSHLFRGRPGGRRHVRSGGRLNDMLMWSWRAMFSGVSSSSRATCQNTEMRRRDRRWDGEVRPVCCSTWSFRTRSHHRVPSRHFWWKASRALTSADSKVPVYAAYSNTDKRM